MRLTVISPEAEDARERRVLEGMVAAGLERYHLRKPTWTTARLEAWLAVLAPAVRRRIVLHQGHALVPRLGLGGRHWRDDGGAPARPDRAAGVATRSCHDLADLRGALGHYDAVLFGPVFPSLSKPGHGGGRGEEEIEAGLERARRLLAARDAAARCTAVVALGGITASRIERCRAAGFDGVAVLGAVWLAPDPLAAFSELLEASRGPGPRGGA